MARINTKTMVSVFLFMHTCLFVLEISILWKFGLIEYMNSNQNRSQTTDTRNAFQARFNDYTSERVQSSKDQNRHSIQETFGVTHATDSHLETNQYSRSRRERCPSPGNARAGFECLLRGEITVILTVYQRNYLYEQLIAACTQTLVPREIIILQNEQHHDILSTIAQVKLRFRSIIINVITTTKNLKFHGRFLLPFLIETDYTSIWDDDMIPGRRWLERAVNTSRALNDSLVGANGRNIHRISYFDTIQKGVGDSCPVAETQVDFVGHSWVFPTDIIRILWQFEWLTFETGEDMQFAFALQKYGIKSYVARQENSDVCAHKKNYGGDTNASYRKYSRKYPIRMWLLLALLRKGFQTLHCMNCDMDTIKKQEQKLWSDVAKSKNFLSPFVYHDTLFKTNVNTVYRPVVSKSHAISHMQTTKDKIVVVIGTRPEAIKMAPVIHTLKEAQGLDVITLVTSQQEDLIPIFLTNFNISTDTLLTNVMSKDQGLSSLTAKLIGGISEILQDIKPGLVLVQGDTTSAFAAAVASFYEQIPIAHVEAGLRTHDLRAPMPEEFNRRVISLLSSLHFAPSNISKSNLIHERIRPESIFVTGNPGIDAALQIQDSDAFRSIDQSIKKFGFFKVLQEGARQDSGVRVILFTCHRRENIGSSTEEIFAAMSSLLSDSENNKIIHYETGSPLEVHVIYPVHPNALGKSARKRFKDNPRMHLIEPVDFLAMTYIMKQVSFIITDSGGLQEEASVHRKPLLVLRHSTERPESIHAGTSRLVGSNYSLILHYAKKLLVDPTFYSEMARQTWPYGDGNSAKRISEIIGRNMLAGSILDHV